MIEINVEHWLGSDVTDPTLLKAMSVEGDVRIPSRGRHERIDTHMDMIRSEFVGRSMLELYHAMLIVLVRREMNLDDVLGRFRHVWRSETDFLLSSLNSRWLVSACDTFVDHPTSPGETGYALAGTLLMNTIKLYETETVSGEVPSREDRPVGMRVELFDGMFSFSVGHGDMPKNLAERVNGARAGEPVTARILRELFRRAQRHDTVYRRMRARHERAETAW